MHPTPLQENLAAFIQAHGFETRVDDEAVYFLLPVTFASGAHGAEWVRVEDYRQARNELGY